MLGIGQVGGSRFQHSRILNMSTLYKSTATAGLGQSRCQCAATGEPLSPGVLAPSAAAQPGGPRIRTVCCTSVDGVCLARGQAQCFARLWIALPCERSVSEGSSGPGIPRPQWSAGGWGHGGHRGNVGHGGHGDNVRCSYASRGGHNAALRASLPFPSQAPGRNRWCPEPPSGAQSAPGTCGGVARRQWTPPRQPPPRSKPRRSGPSQRRRRAGLARLKAGPTVPAAARRAATTVAGAVSAAGAVGGAGAGVVG
jgi:hypothetical protein